MFELPSVLWLPAFLSFAAPAVARWKVWVGWTLWVITAVLAAAALLYLAFGLAALANPVAFVVGDAAGAVDWIGVFLERSVATNVLLLLLSAALTVRVGRAAGAAGDSPGASANDHVE